MRESAIESTSTPRRRAWDRALCSACVATFAIACKIEKLGTIRVEDSTPSAAWGDSSYTIPDQRRNDDRTSDLEQILRDELAFLTSPQLGARRPGSEGALLTEAHLMATFRDLALVPDGDHRGWSQAVPIRAVQVDTAQIILAEPAGDPDATEGDTAKGDTTEAAIHTGETLAIRRTKPGRAGKWRARLELVAAGHGISAPELAHDDYRGREVAGKLVLAHAGIPDTPAFRERGADYARLEYKLDRAFRGGATGCIVLTDLPATDPQWLGLRDRFTAPVVHLEISPRSSASALEFAGIAARETSTRLLQHVHGQHEQSGQSDRSRPKASSVVVEVHAHDLEFTDHNVIARVPGGELPEQVVIVTAHWDAGGLAPQDPRGGAIVDNATGVAILTAMANRAQRWVEEGRPPRRSLMFLASAGGSLDHAGIRHFLESRLIRNEDIAAVINLDTFQLTTTDAPLRMLDDHRSTLRAMLEPADIADKLGVNSDLNRIDAHDPGHRAFLEAGIVAVTLTRGDAKAPDASNTDVSEQLRAGDNLQQLVADAEIAFRIAWSAADAADAPRLLHPNASAPTSSSSATPLGHE